MWAQIGIGVGQLLLIAWGLQRMGVASAERNRQLDQQEEVLAELLRSSREQREGAAGGDGRAIARQSAAAGGDGRAVAPQRVSYPGRSLGAKSPPL
jgi:hypothetical protein